MKTDAQLQADVIAELNWEPAIHATEVGVSVKDGVVTLSGHVSTFAEKWRAESAAQRVSGVKALAVNMEVRISTLGARDDADIAQSAENILSWSTFVPVDSIRVMVEGGWITLTGTVDWHYQKQGATDAVRNLAGVTGVSDQIAIRPKASLTAVKADIEASLQRRAHADANRIFVQVDGTDVTLTGTVHSYAERAIANDSAWGTPGVRNVIDAMTIVY